MSRRLQLLLPRVKRSKRMWLQVLRDRKLWHRRRLLLKERNSRSRRKEGKCKVIKKQRNE